MKVSNKRPPSQMMDFGLKLVFIDSGELTFIFLVRGPLILLRRPLACCF